ncbi:POK8 protein, partial [Chordeiles acutipennis]|nr:POK8 protein [Chordeiles acutipennis]
IAYLGTRITPTAVVPQPVKLNLEIKTLHDVQKLVGAIQWLQNIIGIPPDWMISLFELLKEKAPWEL